MEIDENKQKTPYIRKYLGGIAQYKSRLLLLGFFKITLQLPRSDQRFHFPVT